MKRIIALLGGLALLLGLLSATPAEAAPRYRADVTLNSVGSRYVHDAVPIRGHLSSNSSRITKKLVLQELNARHRWVTKGVKYQKRSGPYVFPSRHPSTVRTQKYRVRVYIKGHLKDTATISVRVVARPKPAPKTCANSPSPTTCPRPKNVIEKKDVVLAPNCVAKTVTTQHQTRTHGWTWSTSARRWVATAWTAWKTSSTSTRPATKDECKTVPPDPGPKPTDVTETRTVDGTPTCATLTVPLLNQTRSHTWTWNGAQWVAAPWTAWATTSQTARPASANDCLHVVGTVPVDAYLPDLRIRNLDKCGLGDRTATDGKCFKIVPNAPLDEDFPNLAGRKLLKFPVITLNVGEGASEIIADRSATSSTDWKAYQTFYGPEGQRSSVVDPGVSFYFAGDGHNHWHVTDFDEYEILDSTGTVKARAEKHGYCLQDNTTYPGFQGQPGVSDTPIYLETTSCGKGLPNALTIIHGLSKGWGDTYPTSLPDQAIDITGLPNGTYTVRVQADAKGAVVESDNGNNTASMQIVIQDDTVTPVAGTATGGLA